MDVDAIVDAVLAAPSADGVWISRFSADELREQARRVDPAAPLAGVTFAVKDNIDVAGLPTTAGCPDFAYTPERDAPVVRRLRAAGAIVVGKTNLDQFATGLTGARSPYGAPESVFGGGLISGGSSSGSAVAVAVGTVDFSLGTDTAGSGRVPAAMNGIIGAKPTRGLLSTLGVVPACRSLDCVSIFSRDAGLAALVMRVARGRERTDPWSREGRRPKAARVRIGLPGSLDFFGDGGQEKAFARFAEGLTASAAEISARAAQASAGSKGDTQADAGTTASSAGDTGTSGVFEVVGEVAIGALLEAGDLLYRGPWVAERLADLGEFLAAHPDSVLPVTRRVLEGGHAFTAVDAFRAQHRLRELWAAAERMWERIDVLALPTVGTTFTHAEIAEDPIGRNLLLGRYTQFANLLDMAAVTIPNGFTGDGRPASVTLFGPAFSDDLLMELAHTLTGGRDTGETGSERAGSGPNRHESAGSGPNRHESTGRPNSNESGGRPLHAGESGTEKPAADEADRARRDGDGWDGPGMTVAVVGLHLSGEPRNGELRERGGTLQSVTRTAPCYRMYELPSGAPGLIRVADGGAAIEIELWRLPAAQVGGFLAGIPAPLSLGRLVLEDGAEVTGFLCEAYAVRGARDITASGGWRNHRSKGADS
ncbi:allophanate hydrolase [Actinoplanes hulinensis]|uniref:allophanate hydrolase n=1 Tax=Actinoplanes hulinensis TaxID=1144547 RepID=UPI0027E2F044|nr:allophanate hydrolase [Actinoplanes hulinensis]